MAYRLLKKLITHLRYDPYAILSKLKLVTESSGGGNSLVAWTTSRKIRRYKLDSFYEALQSPNEPAEYRLFVSGHKKHDGINLYDSIVNSNARDILEFGSGVSTLLMAHALKSVGRSGKVYSVEPDGRWADVVRYHLSSLGLQDHAQVLVSTPRLEEFEGQAVASFDVLPDIRPDLIYVDGPDPKHVVGSVKGLTMSGLHFIVLKDVLLYEWALYAGAKIIIDGRLHNYWFLKRYLKRKYRFRRKLFKNINEIRLVR